MASIVLVLIAIAGVAVLGVTMLVPELIASARTVAPLLAERLPEIEGEPRRQRRRCGRSGAVLPRSRRLLPRPPPRGWRAGREPWPGIDRVLGVRRRALHDLGALQQRVRLRHRGICPGEQVHARQAGESRDGRAPGARARRAHPPRRLARDGHVFQVPLGPVPRGVHLGNPHLLGVLAVPPALCGAHRLSHGAVRLRAVCRRVRLVRHRRVPRHCSPRPSTRCCA